MSKGKGRFGHKKKPKPPSKSNRNGLTPGRNSRRDIKSITTESEDAVDKEVSQRLANEPVDPVNRRGDDGRLLLDPKNYMQDIKMIQVALKRSTLGRGYNVQRKTMMRRRLEEIAAKKEADVITKDGVVTLESAGDKLSIEAIKALEMMDKLDMQRIELADKLEKGDAANPAIPTTVINVQDNSTTHNTVNTVDDRRATLLGLFERIGASEITIDGETIRQGLNSSTAVPLPKG